MAIKNLAVVIHEALAAVCPIEGVCVNNRSKEGWIFRSTADATNQQRQDAQNILNNFDLQSFIDAPEPPTLEDRFAQLTATLLQKGTITAAQLDPIVTGLKT